ncbi:MAG: tyrosine-type recombinase/integrase [Rhodocyclaceae bacterium]|nr:tyrosine-type recombinase/integrase [Rhodocyclaceae bacterium]
MGYQAVKIFPRRHSNLDDFIKSADIKSNVSIKGVLLHCPIVVVIFKDHNEIHWPSTLFLLEHALQSASNEGDTVRTYGECLVDWLMYLDSTKTSLETATEINIQAYRNKLYSPSRKEDRRYSAKTVNLRVGTAIRFHEWAQKNNCLSSPLGLNLVQGTLSTKSIYAGRSWVQRVLPKPTERIPRVLTRDEIAAVIFRAYKPYSLMFRWAVITGMRRSELCRLQISDLPKLNGLSVANQHILEMSIRRKGGREVNVYVPIALVEDTHWYIRTDRPKPESGHEQYLFLSLNGKQVDKGILTKRFRDVADDIGSDATLHHLRHTFAVNTLQILQRRNEAGDNINPLKTLQVLMGHRSIESTEIYLTALDIQSDAVEEALAFLYGASLEQ